MYHYTDGGLRNVWLENGYEVKKTPYGEGIAFHDLDGLTMTICLALTDKVGVLTGTEFRYVRSAGMMLSQPAHWESSWALTVNPSRVGRKPAKYRAGLTNSLAFCTWHTPKVTSPLIGLLNASKPLSVWLSKGSSSKSSKAAGRRPSMKKTPFSVKNRRQLLRRFDPQQFVDIHAPMNHFNSGSVDAKRLG